MSNRAKKTKDHKWTIEDDKVILELTRTPKLSLTDAFKKAAKVLNLNECKCNKRYYYYLRFLTTKEVDAILNKKESKSTTKLSPIDINFKSFDNKESDQLEKDLNNHFNKQITLNSEDLNTLPIEVVKQLVVNKINKLNKNQLISIL